MKQIGVWAKSLGRNKSYLSLFFTISNVLNNISPWQKNTFFRGKIVSETRKLIMLANCSNPASPILIVEGSVYTETVLVSYQQKILIKSNWLSHTEGLNTLEGSIRWMQPTSERTVCWCSRLRSRYAENDATNFGMWDEKWCSGLLRLLSVDIL